MTSTPFNIGIAEGKRPASRVLYPPGGKHSDIFGVDPDPPRYGRRQGFQVQAAQASEAGAAINGTKTVNDVDKAKPNTLEACNASPDVLPEADTSCKVSVTPESTEPAQTVAPQTVASIPTEAATPAPGTTTNPVTTTKRVRVPPGGFSSKLW